MSFAEGRKMNSIKIMPSTVWEGLSCHADGIVTRVNVTQAAPGDGCSVGRWLGGTANMLEIMTYFS